MSEPNDVTRLYVVELPARVVRAASPDDAVNQAIRHALANNASVMVRQVNVGSGQHHDVEWRRPSLEKLVRMEPTPKLL